MKTRLLNLIRDEEGASMIEYALLLALIAVVCVGAVTLIGNATSGKYTETSGELQ